MNFKKVAQDAKLGSKLMEGREKIEMDALVNTYPEGVTITAFDILKNEKETYPVLNFKEDPGAFFFGGTVITSIVNAWISEGLKDGLTEEQVSKELEAGGGVKIKFFKDKARNGKLFFNATVVE